jgi:hypothetical protein
LQPRFSLVFDREGYSPKFMSKMRARRIACLTYNKYPGEDWPEVEFQPHQVCLASGHTVEMRLAERGTLLGKELWVREVRKLSKSGHQTSIVSTDYVRDMIGCATVMFARWCQENFFKYMRENYNLDRLADYSTQEIPESTQVVNPQYREVDGEVRKQVAQLARKRCECDVIVLCDDIEPDKVAEYESRKSALQEEIHDMTRTVEDLKACRKATPRHVLFADLPEEDRFRMLATQGKYFIDTIKLIAYRAETAMVNIARQTMRRQDDARHLVRSLYTMEADLLPDYEDRKLIVRLHQPANRCSAETILNILSELNATETIFPGTDLRLVYKMVS